MKWRLTLAPTSTLLYHPLDILSQRLLFPKLLFFLKTLFFNSTPIHSFTSKFLQTAWHPEYGRYMLEATPGAPYGSKLKDLLTVEPNMRLRRELAQKYLKPNEVPLTITSYPRLGAPGQFLEPHHEPNGDVTRSFFVPDEIINPHARFPCVLFFFFFFSPFLLYFFLIFSNESRSQ